MSAFPEKPAAAAHVSDAHWEAAYLTAVGFAGYQTERHEFFLYHIRNGSTDALRLAEELAIRLIKSGEVPEPVDPIEAAMDAALHDYVHTSLPFEAACRKHFAGLTFPVQP